ncbi:4Fe-4S binding protein [Ideonella alba]|uniref:4Fe-4S binding protein n=1 Tax=Ideonella alba TaxID=2824118 RepID=A0A941BNN2_9BURK|nr:4Fe-4S binding protein [Ideonella alba]MBQ0933514.1 4Fe-4S binding protein [Ideonella alba]
MPPRHRRLFQLAFFALFLIAPALDWLRWDLHEAQLWFLGQRWTLGIDDFRAGRIDATQAALGILLKGFLPGMLAVAAFLAVAWRWGRVYCGWLCPHFSIVELLNATLHRACAKWSLWDRSATPRDDRPADARWWPVFFGLSALFGALWAITLLSYLLPPAEVWGGLVHGTLTPNQARFLAIGTAVFSAEFVLARHLFCRFGCAVGLFQSLVWMANPKGMVVAFDRAKARDCQGCATQRFGQGAACDRGCPMRLHPRDIKRRMFSCVQCGQCLQACDESQSARGRAPVLEWRIGADAVRETLRQRREDRGG